MAYTSRPGQTPQGCSALGVTHLLKYSLSPARLKGLRAPSSPCSFPLAQEGRTAWGPAEHMGRGRRSFPPALLPAARRGTSPIPSPLLPAPLSAPAPPPPLALGLRLTGVKAAGEGDAGQGRGGGGSVRSSPACTRHGGPGTAPALPGRCGAAAGVLPPGDREHRPGQRRGRHTENALPAAGAAVRTEGGGAGLRLLRDEKLPRLKTAGTAARVEPRKEGSACQAVAGAPWHTARVCAGSFPCQLESWETSFPSRETCLCSVLGTSRCPGYPVGICREQCVGGG